MAQRWRVRAGSTVRYRDATGRIHHAMVTGVDSPTQVDLRVGGGAVLNVTRASWRNTIVGWFRCSLPHHHRLVVADSSQAHTAESVTVTTP